MHINLLVLQYQLAIDKFAHLPRRAPEFELQDFFGQILRFVIVDIPHSPIHEIEADSFIYAVTVAAAPAAESIAEPRARAWQFP
jgi:hypothetical protein